jgi:alkane 1-monooxygenase
MRNFISQARFAMFPLAMVAALATFAIGGAWTWLVGLALLVANIAFDAVGEDYLDGVASPWRPFLETVVFSVPVLLVLLTLAMFMLTASPGAPMTALAERLGLAQGGLISWIGTVFTTGHIAGTAAVAFAHELGHRPRRFEWLIAQMALALCLHPSITISHVHGHHVHVGTPHDPSTARRGVSFWRFLPIAVAREIRDAAVFEARRLASRGQPVWSRDNRFLQGMAFLGAWLVLAGLLAGPSGLAALIGSGLIGLIIVEVGNYVTHYGLVRVPGRPVMARHSWNAPRFGSTSSLINISRHSHHHAGATTPYWALELADKAAVHRHGITAMSVLAFVPPLWFAVMAPELADWDARMASEEERAIVAAEART